jgi:CDP-6-deoxy-D-xylo-4-hexulose-3-dehydrase
MQVTYPLASSTWGDEEVQAIQDVVQSGRYTMGPKVFDFEKQFAKRFGATDAVMVNSGSTANLLMLSLLKWKYKLHENPKANIIVPAVGWSTTFFPVAQNDFILNFVDVDPVTYNIDVAKIQDAIDENTVAIMTVNLCGNSCDYDSIIDICNRHNLRLIEDNCESMGAMYKDKYCGTHGMLGSHSFFFSHHLQTMEGGMICVQDQEDADYLRSLRAHGWCRELPDNSSIYNKTGDFFKDSFTFVTPGYSVRPLEMSGAIGSVQLEKWDSILEARIQNKDYFVKQFSNKDYITIQKEIGQSSWFSFGCVLKGRLEGKRDRVVEEFNKRGIEARPLASGNFLAQPVMKELAHIDHGNYEAAENIHTNGFWVGNHAIDCREGIHAMVHSLEAVL